MSWSRVAPALAGVVVLAPAPAVAATIAGTITGPGGVPLPDMEVRAWAEVDAKGWEIITTTRSGGDGGYALTLVPSRYRVDARMPPGYAGNYGDRYYDVADPVSGGYIADDADVIAALGEEPVTGIDITLEVMGGLDGRVLDPSGAPRPGAWVRVERNGEVRIHHNEESKSAEHPGEFLMRGLVPAADYQILVYDPAGLFETALVPGPFTIAADAVGAAGDVALAAMAADPYEDNDAPRCDAGAVDAARFRLDPPQPWASAGAWIGPRGEADVDWFCFPALAGERFFVEASTRFGFAGAERHHPWIDPVVSFWSDGGTVRLRSDDDSGDGPFDARLDTGPLGADGCYCAAVTTFGDVDWTGVGQQSAGRYTLTIAAGNRPPILRVLRGGARVPAPPETVALAENETLVLDLTVVDPDGDDLTVGFTHLDVEEADVPGGALDLAGERGTFSWTADARAGDASPYLVTFTAADAEFATRVAVAIAVATVNEAPGTPVPIAPIGGVVVEDDEPTLEVENAVDPDGDPLVVEFEVEHGEPDGMPEQAGVVPEGDDGTTGFAVAAVADDTRVSWRVRADDGLGGVSPWSEWQTFVVDSVNRPPGRPVLVKPSDGEVVPRRPAASVENVTDPEGDAIAFVFEVALDQDFAEVVTTSEPVPQDDTGKTTDWRVDVELDNGRQYWARARAEDARGGVSEPSEAHMFFVKGNLAPPIEVDGLACDDHELAEAPTAIRVRNYLDPEGDPVSYQLEIADDASGETLFSTTADAHQGQDVTEIPIDATVFAPGGRYRVRVRIGDGEDWSPWVECRLALAPDAVIPGVDGADGGAPDGGCGCRVATPAAGLPWALLAAAAALARSRRRRRR